MAIYPKYGKSTPPDIKKALAFSIGAAEDVPFIAGKRVSATLNFGNISAQTSSDLTIACKGARVGDQVIIGGPAPGTGSCYTGHVAADDLVTVRFNNYSAGAINPASATFIATVIPTEQ